MNEKKRILILALGAGSITKDGLPGYRPTQYVLYDKPYQINGENAKTNFVAEPIINYFEPDEIFILGTISSCWYQLYASTITRNNDDETYKDDTGYMRLCEIRNEIDNDGVRASSEQLEACEKEINKIFKEVPSWEKYSACYKNKKPGIHILLTKYGVTADELRENYSKLKSIETYLKDACEYEVAFDVTHSFRSLPIYNLIIFNYIRNITKFNISISHVFYGMLEVLSENNGIAPIVDLVDIVDVLNLTNGVAEFKDTGNAVSLLSSLDEQSSIRQSLEKFDLATQFNAFDKIKEELKNLFVAASAESPEDRISSIHEMINIVLRDRFLNDSSIDVAGLNNISDTDLKFHLANWFFNQNRMGLGLATGLEALRDIITPVFTSSRNSPDANTENDRKNAESYFSDNIAPNITDAEAENSELKAAIRNLGTKLRTYKDIRNMFAHSLNGLASDDLQDIQNVQVTVRQFKEELHLFKNLCDSRKDELQELFKPRKTKSSGRSDACRIIMNFNLDDDNCFDYGAYKKSKSNRYDVFYLDNKVRKKLFATHKKQNAAERAYFLCKYLDKHLTDLRNNYTTIHIMFAECPNPVDETIFRIFANNQFCDGAKFHFWSISDSESRSYTPLKIFISTSKQEDEFSETTDYANIMDIPLIELGAE